jgi:hypothetical protein
MSTHNTPSKPPRLPTTRHVPKTRYDHVAPTANSQSPFVFRRPSKSKNLAMSSLFALRSRTAQKSDAEPITTYPEKWHSSKPITSHRLYLNKATEPWTAQDENQDEEKDEEEENTVLIHPASDGKWYCPFQHCVKARYGYSAGGLRKHIRGAMHRMRPTTAGIVGKQVVLPKQAHPMALSIGTSPPQLNIAAVTSGEEPNHASSPSSTIPNGQLSEGNEVNLTIDAVVTAEGDKAQVPQELEVIQPAEEHVSGEVDPVNPSDESHGNKYFTDTGPTIPDHQDSRAWPTFTFNQSTQSALLEAQRAFEESQVPERMEVSPLKALAAEPFNENNTPSSRAIPLFSTLDGQNVPTRDRLVLDFPAESTQQLLNEAEAIDPFSTIKKRKQPLAPNQSHISWAISKPFSQTDLALDAAMYDTTPVPLMQKTLPPRSESAKPSRLARRSASQSILSSKPLVTNSWPVPPQSRLSDISQSFQEGTPKLRKFPSTSTSTRTPTFSQLPFTASAPTPMPVASYQQGQNVHDSRGLFRSADGKGDDSDTQADSLNSQDLDANLDAIDTFMASGTLAHDVKKQSGVRRRGGFTAING